VGTEIAAILGYTDKKQAVRVHCKHAKSFKPVDSTGLEIGPRGAYIIPESALYRLIMRISMHDVARFRTGWLRKSSRRSGKPAYRHFTILAPPSSRPTLPSLARLCSPNRWGWDEGRVDSGRPCPAPSFDWVRRRQGVSQSQPVC
jgi:hypothetical protein